MVGKSKDRETDSSGLRLLQHGLHTEDGKKRIVRHCLQSSEPSLYVFTFVSIRSQRCSGPCENHCWRCTYSQSASLRTRAERQAVYLLTQRRWLTIRLCWSETTPPSYPFFLWWSGYKNKLSERCCVIQTFLWLVSTNRGVLCKAHCWATAKQSVQHCICEPQLEQSLQGSVPFASEFCKWKSQIKIFSLIHVYINQNLVILDFWFDGIW